MRRAHSYKRNFWRQTGIFVFLLNCQELNLLAQECGSAHLRPLLFQSLKNSLMFNSQTASNDPRSRLHMNPKQINIFKIITLFLWREIGASSSKTVWKQKWKKWRYLALEQKINVGIRESKLRRQENGLSARPHNSYSPHASDPETQIFL